MANDALVADVKVSEAMDALFLSPRSSSAGSALYSVVRAHLGAEAQLRRTSDGIRVSARNVAGLLTLVGATLKWSAEALQFAENRRRAGLHHAAQVAAIQEIKAENIDRSRQRIADSEGLSTLDGHQIRNVAAMTYPEGLGVCVFDEQGAGKTVTTIFAFDLLVARDEADLAIIVAPKSMVAEWPNDFSRFRGDLYRVAILSGSRVEKLHVLRTAPDVVVMNFETAVSFEGELRALLRSKKKRAVLVVDESFFVKSIDAKRTKALRRLREWCGRAFVLCGTPAPNAPHDLIQQFNLVDFGIAFDGVDVPRDRHDAMLIIQECIERRGLFLRHLKADVLPNLPPRSYQRFFVPLEPIQRRAYEAALSDLILDLEASTESSFKKNLTSFFARRAALLQIASNPAPVIPGYSETPAKLRLLDSLLEDLIDVRGEKVVLWSFYTASIDAIFNRYGRFHPVRFDGTVTDVSERREGVRRFQGDDTSMLFVANPAAAGAGLTLHRSRVAIYESLSNQAAHYLQSLDRIHRRGQSREVQYLMLLTEGTIELEEFDRLTAKESAARQLLGDGIVEHASRDLFLASAHAARELLASTLVAPSR